MTSLKDRKAALTERKSYLEAKLHEIDDELDSHNSPDWEELAVERETDEVLESMGLSGQEEGEYGYCVSCGDKITEERLDVLPYTPFCQSCAAEKAKAK